MRRRKGAKTEGRVTPLKRESGVCERAMTGRAVLDNFGTVDVSAALFVGSQTLSRGATAGSATGEGRAEI